MIKIKEGAVVISDAHYSHLRPELLGLIKDIESKKIKATQLLLMGDIFDALFGGISYTLNQNTEIVKLLNSISQDIELIYLEGNHDFNLKNIFVNAKVFPMQTQPVMCQYEDKTVCLAHGDFDGARGYRIYSSIIRNATVLSTLEFIDKILNNSIIKKIDKYLTKKEDCNEFVGFREFVAKRMSSRVSCDYFIEGHFHQNVAMKFGDLSYINLGAFACNQRYFIVKSLQDKELLEENIFSKGI
ncbi:MAG: metallophosphoesterase [Campylobacterota bacterium]|nr:metallophosphoesterase [Campylobacterota bacterium]